MSVVINEIIVVSDVEAVSSAPSSPHESLPNAPAPTYGARSTHASLLNEPGRPYGVYSALVTNIMDPDGQGRVKVRLPWAPEADGLEYEAWARVATLMAGNGRGSWFIPEVHDEVLIAFAGGSAAHPVVIGALWNGADTPPSSMDGEGENNLKMLRSRNGITFTMDDRKGREQLVLQTPGGQRVTLKDGPGTLHIEDCNGNSIVMGAGGITITASSQVTVDASQVNITAEVAKFSGVVMADSVICNRVMSQSYTPGAGNIW